MKIQSLSYEELEKKYGGLLRMFASWRITDQMPEDLYQELRLVLWKAQQAYRSSKGAAFSTYLYRACLNKVGKLRDKTFAQKRVPAKARVPLCSEQHELAESSYCSMCFELPSVELDTEVIDLLAAASTEAKKVARLVLHDVKRSAWLEKSHLTQDQLKKGISDLKQVLQRR